MLTKVELKGVNGEFFTLAGDGEGDRGVYLATGLSGIYDPPVKVIWEEPANLPGSRYLTHRYLQREIVFGVEIPNDPSPLDSWMERDSEWRKAWSYTRDCTLYITTNYGTRYLKLRLGQQPEVSTETDPNENPINRCVITAVAGDPFWYEDDVVHEWVVPTSTTGITDPALRLTHTIHVDGTNGFVNPTDQIVWPKFTASAPGTFWLPDYSWKADALANRRIQMPTLIAGENIVVDTDPRRPQVVSENGAQVWARMQGVRFRHPIPEYTREADFEIGVMGAPAGAVVTMRLPRPWSRPWGLW